MRRHFLIGVLCLVSSCMDQDIFGLSKRTIDSDFELEMWEDGVTFYLHGPKELQNYWGILEGTVGKVGWDDDTILVWQNECGQGSGWRVINVDKKTLSRIIPNEKVKNDKRLNKIIAYPSDEAWKRLR